MRRFPVCWAHPDRLSRWWVLTFPRMRRVCRGVRTGWSLGLHCTWAFLLSPQVTWKGRELDVLLLALSFLSTDRDRFLRSFFRSWRLCSRNTDIASLLTDSYLNGDSIPWNLFLEHICGKSFPVLSLLKQLFAYWVQTKIRPLKINLD